jgi:hypothetical protein
VAHPSFRSSTSLALRCIGELAPSLVHRVNRCRSLRAMTHIVPSHNRSGTPSGSDATSRESILLAVSSYWRYLDNSMLVILKTWCQKLRTTSSLRRAICGPGHIQCNYISAYVGINIRPKVSAVLLDIIGHIDARYTANLVANIAHVLRFTLCELWSRLYTKYLQLHIFGLQYSAVGICAAIGDIPTLSSALYCKLGAKYSTHPPVYAK